MHTVPFLPLLIALASLACAPASASADAPAGASPASPSEAAPSARPIEDDLAPPDHPAEDPVEALLLEEDSTSGTLDARARLVDEAMRAAVASLGLESRPLKLADAVGMALRNNPQLAMDRIDPEIARARVMSARGAFDVVATAAASQAKSAQQTSADDSASLVGQPPERTSRQTTMRGGLSKFWASGTQTSFDASLLNSSTNFGGEEYATDLAARVRQSLLRGMRPSVNLAPVRQAENAWRGSLHRLESQVIDTVATVERTFWNLALAHELLGVRKFSLDLAERQLERTTAFVDVGRLSPLELTGAEAELATRRSDYISAKNDLERGAIDLLVLIEEDFGAEGTYLLPLPADTVELPKLPGDNAESIRIAMAKRPDLAQAHLDLENGELDVVVTADGLLPRLDLVGSYALNGRGLNEGDSFDRIGTGRYDRWSVGLEFELPIPNRRARGDARAARHSRDQLELSIDNLRRRIRADVLGARIELENRLAGVEAARAAVALQERRLVNEEEKWRNGLSTNLDVFQAQRDLVQSRADLLRGVADALFAEIDLGVQEGSLLETRGYVAEGEDLARLE